MTEWYRLAGTDDLDDPSLSREERIIRHTTARARRNDADELRMVLAEFLRHSTQRG
jgi:hypothetical protein